MLENNIIVLLLIASISILYVNIKWFVRSNSARDQVECTVLKVTRSRGSHNAHLAYDNL